MAAEDGTSPDEEQCPRNGADNREDDESSKGITGYAGREGNKGPDPRKATADDDGKAAVLIKHLFSHVEFFFVEEDVFTVFQ